MLKGFTFILKLLSPLKTKLSSHGVGGGRSRAEEAGRYKTELCLILSVKLPSSDPDCLISDPADPVTTCGPILNLGQDLPALSAAPAQLSPVV